MEAPATYPTLEFSSRYADWDFYGGVPEGNFAKYNHPDTNTYELGVAVAYLDTSYFEGAVDIYEQFVKKPIFTPFIKEGKVDYRLKLSSGRYLIIAFIEGYDWTVLDTEVLKFISFMKLKRIGIESE